MGFQLGIKLIEINDFVLHVSDERDQVQFDWFLILFNN